ncbi:dTDP-4-dehydrorhamnose reductase [Mucilaginibacter daejeonensis]|uniref:dTDP-4-dehydrorhamnose reductase n=1 Tax=Mucilaginibacter daejeonensis TaxID=398049 RepID=UPI001D17073A|nr:dTDP-4-dehydrorhamnose reductase [Mucilaginibacter daejeonensis]UEG52640.1 dTDP-4-dehydrorhamnose reductase [Mucilaginibacter daejeonensis]
MSKILVLGASGQLGHCLKKVAEERQITEVFFPAEDEGNILDIDGIDRLFEKYQPDFAINCAAYTAVDKAEEDTATARKVNKDGAANLAHACKKHGAVLVHVSTDFVFEGVNPYPLVETDAANPINVYGLTKLEGEQAITDILPEHFTLRTSWLYSEFGNNFVKTMLRLGAERDQLNIIADQVGTPTYAIDLAGCILDIIASGSTAYGIYHYSNEGVTSWYDFAVAIFDISSTQVKAYPIRTSQYPTPAVRPTYSVMDKTKVKETFNIQIPYWRHSLEECIKRLGA